MKTVYVADWSTLAHPRAKNVRRSTARDEDGRCRRELRARAFDISSPAPRGGWTTISVKARRRARGIDSTAGGIIPKGAERGIHDRRVAGNVIAGGPLGSRARAGEAGVPVVTARRAGSINGCRSYRVERTLAFTDRTRIELDGRRDAARESRFAPETRGFAATTTGSSEPARPYWSQFSKRKLASPSHVRSWL